MSVSEFLSDERGGENEEEAQLFLGRERGVDGGGDGRSERASERRWKTTNFSLFDAAHKSEDDDRRKTKASHRITRKGNRFLVYVS